MGRMKPLATLAVMLAVLWADSARDTARAQTTEPAVVGAAVAIPGVVRAAAPIERILTGFDGLDDPIGLTDGSLVFSEPGARRLH